MHICQLDLPLGKSAAKNSGRYGPVWYVCLKTENCCLKTSVEIRVGEKVRWNA